MAGTGTALAGHKATKSLQWSTFAGAPARNMGLRPPGETAGDTRRDVLGDSRGRRSPRRRSGCFKWLITCPAKTLISHSNMSGYSFCLLLPVLSLLDSRALQSRRLSPMKVLPCDHQVPLDFIFGDPLLQGAWLSTGLAAWLPAAGPPQPARWCPGTGNLLLGTAVGQESSLLSTFATGRPGMLSKPTGAGGPA